VIVLRVLWLIQQRLGGCGYIKRNGLRDQALVFVVRRRKDLLEEVIPALRVLAALVGQAGGLREVRPNRESDGCRVPSDARRLYGAARDGSIHE
jgi:hypothetical protein